VGAQVIVETHSDHVLNGIRLAVRQKRIKHDAVAIHYFSRHEVPAEGEHRLEHRVQSPLIDSDGRIDHWPDGFFDQMDIALEQLI
jgi:predicted ATPase